MGATSAKLLWSLKLYNAHGVTTHPTIILIL